MSERVTDNPFHVLGLAPTASRIEIERQAQLLHSMLLLDLVAAKTYDTPLGPQPRTVEKVRVAVATLRDPARRLAAELWARATPTVTATERPADDGWPDAMVKTGWAK